MVVFIFEESLDKVWRIWYELFGMLEYGGDGEDSVLADIGVTMLQA